MIWRQRLFGTDRSTLPAATYFIVSSVSPADIVTYIAAVGNPGRRRRLFISFPI